MASSVNPVAIVVTDGVATTIAPNLRAIATGAREADSAVQSLKSTLSTMDKGGVAGLKAAISSVSSSTSTLRNATQRMGTTADTTSGQIIKLAGSYQTLNFAITAAIATLQSATLATGAASTASKGFTISQTGAAAAVKGTADGALAARATFQVLNGSMMGASRAAGVFVANTLGLGTILKVAFPIIGAVALIEVLSQLVTGVQKVAQAFREMGADAVRAETQAILAGEKIIKIKPATGFTEGISKILSGDFESNKDIRVTQVAAQLKELAEARKLLAASNRADEAGLQGLALQQQRVEGIKKEIDLVKQQALNVHLLTDALKSQRDATRTGTITVPSLQRGAAPTVITREVSALSEEQRKAVGDQLRIAVGAAKDLDNEVKVLNFDLTAAEKKEPLAALKDDLKAARAQMKVFEEEFAQLKQQTKGVVSPQQEIDLFKSQRARALPPNIPAIDLKLGNADQTFERQKRALEGLTEKYRDQVAAIGLYDDAKKVEAEQDKINRDLKKQGLDINSAAAVQAKADAKTAIEAATYQKELNRVYTEFNGPLKEYEAGLRAVDKLLQDHKITTTQAANAQKLLTREFQDAVVPANAFNRSLDQEQLLLQKYGRELAVSTAIEALREEMFRRNQSLSATQETQLRQRLTTMAQEREVQSALNTIYNQTVGEKNKLTAQEKAYDKALEDSLIGLKRYKTGILEIQLAVNKLANDRGLGTFRSHFVQMLGDLVDVTKTSAQKMTGIWTNFYGGLERGFADSIGKWAVGTEKLRDALIDVARNAVAELISSLIKLGIELLIISALEKVFPKLKELMANGSGDTSKQTAKNTAFAIAAIAAITAAEFAAITMLEGPAWSLAEAVSLFSFGANAAAAAAGISAVVAVGTAAQGGALTFSQGGLVPGSGSSDTVSSMLTPGEFVIKQSAVRAIGVPTLDAMNRGAKSVQTGSGSGNGTPQVSIKVEHDGSTNVQVEQLSENKVRIIARQEARQTVESHAPSVIASEFDNPNSKPSKAVTRNHVAPRRR